jgi:hypothetical protein
MNNVFFFKDDLGTFFFWGYDVMSLGKKFLMYQWNVVLSSSRITLDLHTLKDEGITFLSNTGNCLSNDTSYSRRTEYPSYK